MATNIIRADLFEIHKPSFMITAEYKTFNKKLKKFEHYSLTPVQHDAMNFLCYLAREQLHTKYNVDNTFESFNNEEELFTFLETQKFTVDLKNLAGFVDKFNSDAHQRQKLSLLLDMLQGVQVKLGIFKQDSVMKEIHEVKTVSLLRNYTKKRNSSIAIYQIEPEILLGWVYKSIPFTKLYLKIQTELNLTYSKILYEICKDYEKLGSVTKPFNEWIIALNLNPMATSTKTFSQLKSYYLNKACQEINKYTDIHIDSITSYKENKKTFVSISFHKQECDLFTYNKIDDEDLLLRYYAEQKFENLPKYRKDKIVSKEHYILKMIETEREEFVAMSKIDAFILSEKKNFTNNNDQPHTLIFESESTDSLYVINNDYLLINIDNKKQMTTSPIETRKLLNDWFAEDSLQIKFIELGIKDDWSNSTIND